MRKAILILLCIALLLPILWLSLPVTVNAADSYLITIVEDTVLTDVNNNGMAVYINGIIYIPYHSLKSINGLTVNYDQDNQFVTVHRPGTLMYFELDSGLTYEYFSRRTVNVPAVIRDSVPYLPVAILANWMKLYFSFTSATDTNVGYPIIRLCANAPATSDSVLYRLHASQISSVAKARDKKSGLNTPEPVAPLPERTLAIMFMPQVQTQEQETPTEEVPLYASILDELTNYNLSASFFYSEESLVPEQETLREIYARGFYPGILLTDSEAPLDEANRCSEIYAQVLHSRIRLVTTQDFELTQEQNTALTEAGFLVWEADHKPDTDKLSSNKLLSAIKTSLKKASVSSVLQLIVSENSLEIIPMLYSYLESQNFTVIPMSELQKPF